MVSDRNVESASLDVSSSTTCPAIDQLFVSRAYTHEGYRNTQLVFNILYESTRFRYQVLKTSLSPILVTQVIGPKQRDLRRTSGSNRFPHKIDIEATDASKSLRHASEFAYGLGVTADPLKVFPGDFVGQRAGVSTHADREGADDHDDVRDG